MANVTYDTAKFGGVLDAKYDGPGRRLATACADRVARVWGVEAGKLLSELRSHKAAVVTLSWAHGRFAGLLASGSDDGQVVIWREVRPEDWQVAHQINVTGSANVVAWCPPEYGLSLAVAGGDDLGVVTMVSRREGSGGNSAGDQWQARSFAAHGGGVAALSWSPSTSAATLATGPAVGRAAAVAPCRLVTCGADGAVSVWHTDGKMDSWRKQHDLSAEGFRGQPRDVAWRPNVGLPSSLLAACSDQGSVAIWSQDMDGQPWSLRACWQVDGDARRLAWSRAGMLLSVSVGDDGAAVYREGPDGAWELASTLEE